MGAVAIDSGVDGLATTSAGHIVGSTTEKVIPGTGVVAGLVGGVAYTTITTVVDPLEPAKYGIKDKLLKKDKEKGK